MRRRLHLVGAGNLGGALLNAWTTSPEFDCWDISVADPRPSEGVTKLCRDAGVSLNPRDLETINICVLAIKPQSFRSVLPALAWPQLEETVFVSIAAGLSIESIREMLPAGAALKRIIRAMPNLPVAIGQGATILCSEGSPLTDSDHCVVTALFEAAGKTVWTKTEDELDRLMGVSACGPAYLFLLAEVLEEVAASYGASPGDARALAEATVIGAANHLAKDGRRSSELREAVTSPAGTTAEALAVLDGNPGIRSLMKAAVDAAYMRAHALKGAIA